MEKEKKELNLVDLLQWLADGLKNLFRKGLSLLGWCLRTLFRQWYVLLTCLVLGGMFGYVQYTRHQVYKSGFAVGSIAKLPYYSIEILKALDRDCAKGHLAETLGLDSATAGQVCSIQPYYAVDFLQDGTIDLIDYKGHYRMDTTNLVSAFKVFYVEVFTKSEAVVPELQQALLDYLCQQPVLKNSWEVYVESEKEWVDMLRREMSRVDSIHSLYLASGVGGASTLMKKESQGSLNYMTGNWVQVLTNEKNNIERNIFYHRQKLGDLLLGPVFCNTPVAYEGPVLSLTATVGRYAFIGLILGYLIVILWRYRKDIHAYLNKE